MPRENRKRGKRHRKSEKEEEPEYQNDEQVQDYEERPEAARQDGPSWIVSTPHDQNADREAPFGYVDPDVKAYFRTVDQQLREWIENPAAEHITGNEDSEEPSAERKAFFTAALTEMSGKEKQLATDPDCSNVLERMAHSMDDFIKRVFMDRLAGSFVQLSKHRFASHVVQTFLSVSLGTVTRERRGIFPPAPSDNDDDDGHLPTMTSIVLGVCEELLSCLTDLLLDPFASHVLRSLILLLSPTISLPSSATKSVESSLRSKKSAKYKAKQGVMKSIISDVTDSQRSGSAEVPAEFGEMARKLVHKVRSELGANEIRAMAADKVACPNLSLLISLEHSLNISFEENSILDSVSCGIATACLQDPPEIPPPSDFVTTLLRETVSSHLLENILSLSPQPIFDVLWQQYIQDSLHKLAVHPVANFVVSRAVERVSAKQLEGLLSEMKGVWPKLLKTSRTSVLRAVIDRSATLQSSEAGAVEGFKETFDLDQSNALQATVYCVLKMQSGKDFVEGPDQATEADSHQKSKGSSLYTVQGSIILQSLLRLHEPHHELVTNSILALPPDSLINLSHDPTSSRIFDALLTSPTIPQKIKRKFLLSLIGHYHLLVDDRTGSFVGDQCWAAADPYLKEKIARSVIPHENALIGSQYGKYFSRKLQLHVLKRRPEEWKDMQAKASLATSATANAVSPLKAAVSLPGQVTQPAGTPDAKKRKRKEKPMDEIDELFSTSFGNKTKKSKLNEEVDTEKPKEDVVMKPMIETSSVPKDLQSVLAAIKEAPGGGEKSNGKKKTKRRS